MNPYRKNLIELVFGVVVVFVGAVVVTEAVEHLSQTIDFWNTLRFVAGVLTIWWGWDVVEGRWRNV